MRLFWPCVILVLATGLVYVNSFPGAFHFDDFPLLLENPRINGSAFSYSSFLEQYGGRPLTLWTFYWNNQWFGQNPSSYHLVSVLCHILVVVEIFLLIWQLFGQRALAFGSALLFAIHPLNTQAVNYIWSRSVLLMAAFGLAALLLARRHPWAGLICLQLAIWSRAEAVILLLPLIFLNRSRWKGPLTVSLLNTAAFAYSLFKYAPREIAWTHPDPLSYWILQPLAFLKYSLLMIWPTGLNLDHDLVSPDPWSLLLATLFFLSLLMLALRFRKSYPIPTLGIFWMMAMLVPSLLVPNSDVLNESRTYLSLAGFTLTASWVLCHFLAKSPGTLKLAAVALSLLLFMPLTMARNETWKDDSVLWQDTVLKSPAKARAHYNLGVALAVQGKNRQSEVEFQRARDLHPEDHLSWAALAYCAEVQDNLKMARSLFQQSLRLKPENGYARGGLERVERRLSRERKEEL